jgi:hypothetical protein
MRSGRTSLDCEHALHIDLAEAIASKKILSAGGFPEGLLQAAEDVRNNAVAQSSAVIRISDKLGLAFAKRSILDFVLDKWARVIGGSSLTPFATRRGGPVVADPRWTRAAVPEPIAVHETIHQFLWRSNRGCPTRPCAGLSKWTIQLRCGLSFPRKWAAARRSSTIQGRQPITLRPIRAPMVRRCRTDPGFG